MSKQVRTIAINFVFSMAIASCDDGRVCKYGATAHIVRVGVCDTYGRCGVELSDGRYRFYDRPMVDMPYVEFVCEQGRGGEG
jgi:hypothetical protein